MVLGTCPKRRSLCLLYKGERLASRQLQDKLLFWSVGRLVRIASLTVNQGGSMSISISEISSSPALQWLQNSLSATGISGNPQTAGASSGSPFQQALQAITNQTALPTDVSQSLSVNGAQGQHHHHHRYGGGESSNQGNGSFMNQLAQSILSDLQQADDTGASSATSSSSTSNGSGESFIDGLANAIAN